MRRGNVIPYRLVLAAAMIVAIVAAGCGSSPPAATSTPTTAAAGSAVVFTSSVLVDTHENALPATSQLVLGTLRLEDTPHKVTREQAARLLPLWQMLNSTAMQDAAEASAVLRQVDAAMTPEQLQAIKAMNLTMDDLMAWAQAHDIDLVFRPEDAPGAVPNSTPGAWPTLAPEMQATMAGAGRPDRSGPGRAVVARA